jgi:predicted acyltransferase
VRLPSVDVYRGFTMLLLAAFSFSGWQEPIQRAHQGNRLLVAALDQFEHVEWTGLALWDMIQPSFMFLAGTSLALSCHARRSRGDSSAKLLGHAASRAVALVLLGVFLRSLGSETTNWTLEDVVTQMGLGFVPLYLLWGRPRRVQAAALGAILLGYWLLFALWPLPKPDYDYAAVDGVQYFQGFQAHWNKNAHPAHDFDVWLLNRFPRPTPFVANRGGYNTLNFVPSLATMIAGLMAGELLAGVKDRRKTTSLLIGVGFVCVALGVLAAATGMCPIVKRIWTPSFGLLSTGLCLATLGTVSYLVDERDLHWPGRALAAVGRNSLVMYLLHWIAPQWTAKNLETHLGAGVFQAFGPAYELLLKNLAVGACFWLACWYLDRKKWYVKL